MLELGLHVPSLPPPPPTSLSLAAAARCGVRTLARPGKSEALAEARERKIERRVSILHRSWCDLDMWVTWRFPGVRTATGVQHECGNEVSRFLCTATLMELQQTRTPFAAGTRLPADGAVRRQLQSDAEWHVYCQPNDKKNTFRVVSVWQWRHDYWWVYYLIYKVQALIDPTSVNFRRHQESIYLKPTVSSYLGSHPPLIVTPVLDMTWKYYLIEAPFPLSFFTWHHMNSRVLHGDDVHFVFSLFLDTTKQLVTFHLPRSDTALVLAKTWIKEK